MIIIMIVIIIIIIRIIITIIIIEYHRANCTIERSLMHCPTRGD